MGPFLYWENVKLRKLTHIILYTSSNKTAKCVTQKFLEIKRDIEETAIVVKDSKISEYLTDDGGNMYVFGVSK